MMAPTRLAKRVEIDLVDDDAERDGGSFRQQMQMTAGLLRQAAALGGQGRSVEVLVHLHTAERRVVDGRRQAQVDHVDDTAAPHEFLRGCQVGHEHGRQACGRVVGSTQRTDERRRPRL